MTKSTPALIAVLATALMVPAVAPARVTELGSIFANQSMPLCPARPCQAVTRTTGFQLSGNTRRNLFAAPRTGRIVAFTLRLGTPNKRQTSFFEQESGGDAQARIAILRPMPSKRRGQVLYRLQAQSDAFKLTGYFGKTVQFPLYTSLLVRKGFVVALSIPTWAPVLALSNLDNSFSWRSSRVKPCSTDTERQPPQTTPGSVRQYFCTYRPALLTYTATLVSTP